MITKGQLESARFYDITVTETPDGEKVLLLLCEDHEKADLLWGLLNNNLYVITLSDYLFRIDFVGQENAWMSLKLDPEYVNEYTINHIKSGLLPYVTCGVYLGNGHFGQLPALDFRK